MNTEDLVKLAIDALEDIKAKDIVCIDVSKQTSVTDIMIVACGGSTRQVKAIANSVAMKAKENGILPLGTEGQQDAEWVLIDLAEVIVHVMLPTTREYYDIEKLWKERPNSTIDSSK